MQGLDAPASGRRDRSFSFFSCRGGYVTALAVPDSRAVHIRKIKCVPNNRTLVTWCVAALEHDREKCSVKASEYMKKFTHILNSSQLRVNSLHSSFINAPAEKSHPRRTLLKSPTSEICPYDSWCILDQCAHLLSIWSKV